MFACLSRLQTHVEKPVPQVRGHDVAHADVVVEELALGRPRAREDDAVQVADVEPPAADLELAGCGARCHAKALPARPWNTLDVAETGLVEQAAEELYGLLPGEFTRARDARAKQLRGQGEREAAAAVKALKRPTVAAWALNQLSRRRADELGELLAAGEQLRSAQEELLGGGERSAFQDAAAKERALVAKLSADATAVASEAGERAGGLREKVSETLHAAALDEETAEELRAGRLVREREAIGGFAGTAVPTARASGGSDPAPSAPSRAPRRPKRERREVGTGAAEKAARKQRLTVARTDERHARRELEAAERAVQNAQGRAEAAEAHAREASERARTTAERLKEAKRAQTAARKAHARAERALARAESGGS
jgi:hypothetical protein